MLYYIDESVVLAAKEGDSLVIDRLKDLEYAWRKGQCLVSASRQSFNSLQEILDLEGYHLLAKFAQGVHSLYATLDFFVVLVYEVQQIKVLQQFSNKYKILDIRELDDPKKITNNYLVCENVKDSSFYINGTSFMMANQMEPTYRLNVIEGNGGGGTIVEVLDKYKDYPCLAICDSDKKYPLCSIGETLSGVTDYFKATHGRLLWIYALYVHELENLIPFEIIQKVRKTKVGKRKINKLKEINDAENGKSYLQYFDFKKGISCELIAKIYKEDHAFYAVCKSVLQLSDAFDKDLEKIITLNIDCSKVLMQGFGDDIFKDSLEYMSNNNLNSSDFKLCEYQSEDWNHISNKVWSLGCAMKPKKV